MITCTNEAQQNVQPQNTPVWHVEYFEMKSIKTQGTQGQVFQFSFVFYHPHPLPAYKKLERGSILRRELLPEKTFSSERCACVAGQTFIQQTLLFPLSWDLLISPLKPQDLIYILSSGWYISLASLDSHIFVGLPSVRH